MRSGLFLGVFCGLLGQLQGQVAPAALAQGRAAVRVEVAQPTWFVGQAVPIRLVIEIDLAWFGEHGVPQFRREVDLPVQVLAPWFEAIEGVDRLPDAMPGQESLGDDQATRSSVAIGSAVLRAVRRPDIDRGGRTFAVYVCERRFRCDQPRRLELTAPRLRFAYATRFVDDIVQGRTAVDRHLATIDGAPTSLTVMALPQRGQPADFGGAVGQFRVRTSAAPTELEVGDLLQLELVIEGEGNLVALRVPRLDGLAGFHLLGAIERERSDSRRTVVYDLEPRSTSVAQVPAVGLWFFDPAAPGRYRSTSSAPIPVVVRARVGGEGVGAGPAGVAPAGDPGTAAASADVALADIYTIAAMPRDVGARPSTESVLLAALGPWLLAAALWWGRRARSRERVGQARVETTPAAFAAAVARGDADLATAYAVFLSARIGCAPAAVEGEDLGARLVSAGVPDQLAMRAVRLRDSLRAARYAGITTGASVAAQHLIDELAAAFDRVQAGP